MKQYVAKVAATCYQLRRLRQIRRRVGREVTIRLIWATVMSRIDYCNSALSGSPQSTLAPLQRVQNAAARLVFELGAREHVTYTQPTPVALAPRTLAYPVQTVLPNALSLSWKLKAQCT